MILSNKALKQFVIGAVRETEPTPMRCQHADECGGCAFQDRAYEAQLAVKTRALQQIWDEALPGLAPEPLAVVASPEPFGYRTRMDYAANRWRMGLRRSGKFNWVVDLSECHLIPPSSFAAIRAVYDRSVELGLRDYNLRSHQGFTRYFVVRRSPQGTLMLAVVTASREHAAEMEQLAQVALAQEHVVSFHWLLNDRLTDLSWGDSIQHWGQELLPMQVGQRSLDIGPNTFFQNNIFLLGPLLDDVAAACDLGAGLPSVADLYGGVGTISLHLADSASRVVTVEEFGESSALAQRNIQQNGVANVQAVHADTLAYLKDQVPGAFDVVVVDPPRIGLGEDVCRELVRIAPKRLVYVSCNPITQVVDIPVLLKGFRLAELRGYDMFPQTPHLESLAILDRI
ncbi:23S rRNA (uracil(1939)-C(5))-methyltransferase RlmD [Chloroflexia bacterium SDU3-3]|nr:23S rRNA (uracil(1939)-C(5))-methyltransferase RlmD [Chloroflexia bacterium SDU3-3]